MLCLPCHRGLCCSRGAQPGRGLAAGYIPSQDPMGMPRGEAKPQNTITVLRRGESCFGWSWGLGPTLGPRLITGTSRLGAAGVLLPCLHRGHGRGSVDCSPPWTCWISWMVSEPPGAPTEWSGAREPTEVPLQHQQSTRSPLHPWSTEHPQLLPRGEQGLERGEGTTKFWQRPCMGLERGRQYVALTEWVPRRAAGPCRGSGCCTQPGTGCSPLPPLPGPRNCPGAMSQGMLCQDRDTGPAMATSFPFTTPESTSPAPLLVGTSAGQGAGAIHPPHPRGRRPQAEAAGAAPCCSHSWTFWGS